MKPGNILLVKEYFPYHNVKYPLKSKALLSCHFLYYLFSQILTYFFFSKFIERNRDGWNSL